MKLDSVTAFQHSNLSQKSDVKSVESVNNALDSNDLSSRFLNVKGDQNSVCRDLNGCQRDVDRSPNKINDADYMGMASEADHSVPVDDSANGKEDDERKLAEPCAHSTREMEPLEKESDRFYVDKSVMECELPELIVCYRESAEHVVKDICVDEGLPCKDKVLFESAVDEYKNDSGCAYSQMEPKSQLAKEESDASISIPNLVLVSDKNELGKDSALLCSSKDSVRSGESNHEATNMTENDDSDGSVLDESKSDSASYSLIEQKSELVDKESDTTVFIPDRPAVLESDKLDEDSAMLCSSMDLLKSEESNDEQTNMIRDEVSEDVVNNCNGACQYSETEQRSELVKEELDTSISVADGVHDSKNIELENDSAKCSFRDSVDSGEAAVEEINKIGDNSTREMMDTDQQSIQSYTEANLGSLASVSKSEEPSKNTTEETALTTPMSSALKDSKNITFSGELADMEEGGSITFDFDSSAPVSSSTEVRSEDDLHKMVESQSTPGIGNGISDGRLVSDQELNGHGETSFSMSGPISGRISYSGAVPYSGSISLRSDGSATSARSFAFPVLQTEWNSSPVRMAKADKKALQKHRRWRYGLFCCRF